MRDFLERKEEKVEGKLVRNLNQREKREMEGNLRKILHILEKGLLGFQNYVMRPSRRASKMLKSVKNRMVKKSRKEQAYVTYF